MSRTRISLLVVALLLAGLVVWLTIESRNNRMTAAIASSNGSNYSLELPPEMEPAYFNDNASFQYHSETGDYSVMIIDDSKEKIASYGLDYDLDTYMKIATRTLDSAGMYVNANITVNDVKALQATIKGKRDGVATTFVLTCIETPRFYYQLVCWTPTDRFDVNRETLDAIIASFTEENPQPGGEKLPVDK